MFSYAFGQAIFGKIFDWIGTRIGFVFINWVWSIATASSCICKRSSKFFYFQITIRSCLRQETGQELPKEMQNGFPQKNEHLLKEFLIQGQQLEELLLYPTIAFLSIYFSWQMIFIIIGLIGILWLIPWLILSKSTT